MPLLKQGAIVDDPWVYVGDDDDLPNGGPVIVTLKRWREDRDALMARGTQVGIRLTSEQTPGQVEDDLRHFGVVALEFPAFTDGRSYSNARRLRDRFNYPGEVRAVGDILRDQYFQYHRCGFDAIEIKDGETAADWARATSIITTPYQPASDGADNVLSLRQRRAAAGG
ncbi:MAG: DUF934 domain-containing protein [Magnetovibrio sp.]|nr:DUF934 domain-containing protein [Magnetovibrio sp.]